MIIGPVNLEILDNKIHIFTLDEIKKDIENINYTESEKLDNKEKVTIITLGSIELTYYGNILHKLIIKHKVKSEYSIYLRDLYGHKVPVSEMLDVIIDYHESVLKVTQHMRSAGGNTVYKHNLGIEGRLFKATLNIWHKCTIEYVIIKDRYLESIKGNKLKAIRVNGKQIEFKSLPKLLNSIQHVEYSYTPSYNVNRIRETEVIDTDSLDMGNSGSFKRYEETNEDELIAKKYLNNQLFKLDVCEVCIANIAFYYNYADLDCIKIVNYKKSDCTIEFVDEFDNVRNINDILNLASMIHLNNTINYDEVEGFVREASIDNENEPDEIYSTYYGYLATFSRTQFGSYIIFMPTLEVE